MGWAGEPGYSSRQALDGLREARRLLGRPAATSVDCSIPHLESAIGCLSALEGRLRREPPDGDDPRELRRELRRELDRIRREVRHVNALLENAGRFYAGLGQLLAAAGDAVTYSPEGRLEPGEARPRLRLEG